jgi:alkyl sulfatase BDS1-like metallo-beta-lactamase superfamily hydrolase
MAKAPPRASSLCSLDRAAGMPRFDRKIHGRRGSCEVGAPGVFDKQFFGEGFSLDDVRSGHEPLTRNFASASMLAQLKMDLVWLREQVLTATRRGDERGAIHQANLIPPGLLNDQPDVYQPYLILREHVIDRLYDQNVGYWQPDLQGLEHLTRADHAELLVDYLGVSERQLVKTVERLTADGKYELAASLLESSGDRFERSASVANAKRLVYLKLMEKHQNTDPFKFIIYSGKIREQTPQMAATK